MKHTSRTALGNVTKHSLRDLVRKLLMFQEPPAAWQHPHKGFVRQPTAAHDPQPCVSTLPGQRAAQRPAGTSAVPQTQYEESRGVFTPEVAAMGNE